MSRPPSSQHSGRRTFSRELREAMIQQGVASLAASGRIRVQRSRLQNRFDESENSVHSDGSNRSNAGSSSAHERPPSIWSPTQSTSSMSSPEVSLLNSTTEDTVEVCETMDTVDTLEFLGFTKHAAEEMHRDRTSQTEKDTDTLEHALKTLNHKSQQHRRSYSTDEDWNSVLQDLGIQEELVDAIMDPKFRALRRTEAPLFWARDSVAARWDTLAWFEKFGGAQQTNQQILAQFSTMTLGTIPETDTDTARPAKIPGSTTLWKGTSKIRANMLWAHSNRAGRFDPSSILSVAGRDFNGNGRALYLTPDLACAKQYACYRKRRADSGGAVVMKFTIPNDILENEEFDKIVLRFPDDNFKRWVYHCKRQEASLLKGAPYKRLLNADIIIGDTIGGAKERIQNLTNWTDISERHLLKIKQEDNEKEFRRATQFCLSVYFAGHIEPKMLKILTVDSTQEAEKESALMDEEEFERLLRMEEDNEQLHPDRR